MCVHTSLIVVSSIPALLNPENSASSVVAFLLPLEAFFQLLAFSLTAMLAFSATMAAGKGQQVLLLLWKNWLIQKRKILLTCFEIGLPTFFSLVLLLIRMRVKVDVTNEPTLWEAFSVDQFDEKLVPFGTGTIGGAGGLGGTGGAEAPVVGGGDGGGGSPGGTGGQGAPGAGALGSGALGGLGKGLAGFLDPKWQLAYTPANNAVVDAIMAKVAIRLDCWLTGKC